MADVLVVGAGLAGARTCAALRESGCTARLTLVGREPEPPYDRPPLTKQPGAQVDLREVMGLDVLALADEVHLGVAATGLSRSGDQLEVGLSDGRVVRADAVVLACGSDPVVPAGWLGPGVHVLHTRAQAEAFWAAVGPGVPLLVVGGGWIGCEAAATAASRGARVELVETNDRLLAGRVPAAVADRVATWLAEAGVRLHLGRPVEEVRPGSGASVGGTLLRGAPILLGLGVRPATAWLSGSPVDRTAEGAVRTDEWGRSSLPGLFAVGDVAAWWSPRYRRHLPGGHWTDALNRPAAIAPAIRDWTCSDRSAGHWSAPAGPAPADPIPYVFGEVGGRTLQALGVAGAPGEVHWREESGAFTAYLVSEGRLLGVCAVGRPRDVAAARRAMLADPHGTPPAAGLVPGCRVVG